MIARNGKLSKAWLLVIGVIASLAAGAPALGSGAGAGAAGSGVGTLPGQLKAVSGTTPHNAWSVGSYFSPSSRPGTGGATKTLIEHWNGRGWSKVPSPNPGGPDGSYLYGVSAVSASNAWAVGNYFANADLTDVRTLIEHWDGTSWTVVPSPSPAGYVVLHEVSATSASDAWAVGLQRTATRTKTLIEHWDGTSWTNMSSPSPGDDDILFSVSAVSSSDAWAVGHHYDGTRYLTLIEHWDGTSWTQVPSPSPGTRSVDLQGVSALSATNAWAVGSYIPAGNTKTKPLVEHWDGTSWTKVRCPIGSSHAQLWGVSAASDDDVWAVGRYSSGDLAKALTMHWDGTRWTKLRGPGPGGDDQLWGVSAVSSTTAWAVGDTYDTIRWHPLSAHWDGTRWSSSS